MNRPHPVSLYDSQNQVQCYYDERFDQLVYGNGHRVARPPHLSRDDLISTKGRTFYNHPEPLSLRASHPLDAPSQSDPQKNEGEFTRSNFGDTIRATEPDVSASPRTFPGVPTYMSSDHSVPGFIDAWRPSIRPRGVTLDSEASGAVSSSLQPVASCHFPVVRIRQTTEGGNILQLYNTQQAIQSSRPEALEPIAHLNPSKNVACPDTDLAATTLHADFSRKQKAKKFFVTGKVFLTLWAEPAGDLGDSSYTVITDGITTDSFGEPVFSKIRRFVVVREGDQSCAALPVVTYGHQGVSKKGVNKSEHAIIYTGRKAPLPLSTELPGRGEQGLLPQSIRVDPDDPERKLDPLSRIDFAKVYTIQHNVKVRSLGKVNRASMQPLLYQFKAVWSKYFDEPGAKSWRRDSQPSRTLKLNSLASGSQSELIAAYKALRACGLTAEQARAPLIQAGFTLTSAEFDEISMSERGDNKPTSMDGADDNSIAESEEESTVIADSYNVFDR